MSAIAAVQILTRRWVQPLIERSSDKFSSGNPRHRHENPIKPAPSRGPPSPTRIRPGRRNHFDAGAVARCLKQRETQRILLSAKYSAYQSLLVFSNPTAPAVLAHFEVVQGERGRRRKAGHIRYANLLFPSLSRAANTIGGPSLDCERSSISRALTSHKPQRPRHPKRVAAPGVCLATRLTSDRDRQVGLFVAAYIRRPRFASRSGVPVSARRRRRA